MSETLYRKYRSQSFDDLYGQDAIKKVLSQVIKDSSWGHAYLFSGPRGTGKTSTARILAKAVNCSNRKGANPCNTCDSCLAIGKGAYLDLIEIDAASNRGIDEIRSLKEKVNFSPVKGDTKVYIIDEVHMLTQEAFNALLKTLEEPPDHAIFILATTEPHKMPPTILSRCQRFDFKLATDKEIVKKLSAIARAEKQDVDKEVLDLIARLGRGSFRDSETIFEKVLRGVHTKRITYKDAQSSLGLADTDKIEVLVDFILQNDISKALSEFHDLYNAGVDVHQIFSQVLEILRLRMLELYEEPVTLSPIISAIKTVADSEFKARRSSHPHLLFELAIAELCSNDGDKKPETKAKPASVVSNSKQKERKKNPIRQTKDNLISLSFVKKRWGAILTELKTFNHHLSAFLQKSEPVSIEGSKVLINVPFQFHKERIENPKSREAFMNASVKVFDTSLIPVCAVVKPATQSKTESNEDAVLEVFGEILG